jgi:hypothetical protein
MILRFLVAVLFVVAFFAPSAAGSKRGNVEVSFLMCYRPNHPEDPATRAMTKFARENPDVTPKQ